MIVPILAKVTNNSTLALDIQPRLNSLATVVIDDRIVLEFLLLGTLVFADQEERSIQKHKDKPSDPLQTDLDLLN